MIRRRGGSARDARGGVDSRREGGKWEAVERKIMQRAELQITRCRGGKGVDLSSWRQRERERGRLLFVLFVDYTNNVRRPAKRREEKECGGGKVRDGEWKRAGIKRSRYKAGY